MSAIINHQCLFLPMLIALAISAQPLTRQPGRFGPVLPDAIGDFHRALGLKLQVPRLDRGLLREYGLRQESSAVYQNPAGRRMDAEGLRFAPFEGGHAAFLALQPKQALGSGLAVPRHACAMRGSGITVVEWGNYVLRFHRSAPGIQDMKLILDRLPDPDLAGSETMACNDFRLDPSERHLLGPVSLSRFAPVVPPSVAGFRLGARGEIARFETPSGSISRLVFEYPSPALAQERLELFRALHGARAKAFGPKIGVVFSPANVDDADEILNELAEFPSLESIVSWDPQFVCGPLTLENSLFPQSLSALLLGCLIAAVRRASQWKTGIPNRTISLNIERR